MDLNKITTNITNGIKTKVSKTVLNPLNEMIDQNITDITTTIGSFIIRSIRGKFQRSITFNIGYNYADLWMEEALYGILYQYNDIKQSSRLDLRNKTGITDGTAMYYMLDDGTHNLKYRNYDILLCIQTKLPQITNGRAVAQRVYTIITYDLSPEFVKQFENDMLAHRNSLLKIKKDAPTVTVYQDYHESDGFTYWERYLNINKRKLSTIYVPMETKKTIVNTVNEFFANKEYYKRHGIAHNLKILLYGEPGPQPVSTLIPTPDGMKRMGDLQVGDKVFDRLGNETTVVGVYPKGIQDVYQVLFMDGRSANCTINHLWTVFKYVNGEWEQEVIPLAEIINNSKVVSKANGVNSLYGPYSIPMNGKAQFKEKDVSVDPYVMGVLIANGYLDDEYLSIYSEKKDIIDRVAEICDLVVESTSTESNGFVYRFSYKNGNAVRTKDFLKDYPELLHISNKDRKIPDDYLYNSVENRMSLLQGLLDTDGNVNVEMDYPGISFTSFSRELTEQFIWLMHSLGLSCRICRSNMPKHLSNELNEVSVSITSEVLPTLFRTQQMIDIAVEYINVYKGKTDDQMMNSDTRFVNEYDKVKIVGFKKLEGQSEVMCIKVDNEEHCYLTEDFIVTHNTGKDSIAKMIASEWNRNIYYVTGGKDGKFIPNAITSRSSDVTSPLFLISDIDKYPFLINEPDMTMDDKEAGSKDEKIRHKQMFGSMINALDGVLSGEDGIVVMTTNHIEKFSKTFLRPGRVDLCLNISYVTPEVFRKYTYDFYNVKLPENLQLKKKDITVAMLQFDVVFLKLTADEFIKKYVK